MNKFTHAIVKHKKIVLIAFLFISIVSAILSTFVTVNYNLVDYLPENAQSTIAIRIMESEFKDPMPNARIMLNKVSIQEALEYKSKIAALDGITSISWLDDVVGLDTLKTTPLEYLDENILKNYYKDTNALMSISIEAGKETSTVNAIYSLIGKDNAAAGESFNTAEVQSMSVSEVMKAMMILLPVIIIILIISTTSWFEPLLFLISIGVAIIINMGTNLIFGEISFITQTVSPILQLAVSLDYAIFLLHSFNDHRRSHEPEEAMKLAMKEALPTVAASAATTIIGFAALIFMRFGIGADLGLILLKGITLSFISVMVFLPVVTLMSYKMIDKTRHRKLLPSFHRVAGGLMKIRVPFLIIAFVVAIPTLLAQSHTEFMYGMGSITATSRVGEDTVRIEKAFGKENPLLLLVPRDSVGKEARLCDDLSEIKHVTSIVTYATVVGAEIPTQFVPKEVYDQFYSENYTRIVLYTDAAEEGADSFAMVQSILDTSAKYYDSYYVTGQSATLFDMMKVISVDTRIINLVAIVGIFIVLLVTFRSLSIPVFLVFTIETAIWINLSFPYFSNQSLSFIGYLILSTVQLGATVDYAILLTSYYLNHRKTLGKLEAMRITLGDNLVAVLISATILSTAGFTLALTSNNPIIAELGTLLGRGTLLSLTMVACVLPALLVLFDKLIQKTTWNKK
ncbi:MAG: antibiotic export protein [Firmicutes bacterium]|nr:antibiotic export protein [Bacillota bacterium]